ncbi:hypothetical protein BKA70DRAFT_1434470 [Coprinopsis sp. MPI-PUGE-AT-0042]|nr:hypothetical protein BKA70DRAFT_1434470 [Coprinopsis sp. MPI-PUGE-AT-0042]
MKEEDEGESIMELYGILNVLNVRRREVVNCFRVAAWETSKPPSLEKSPKSTSFFGYSKRARNPGFKSKSLASTWTFPARLNFEVNVKFAGCPQGGRGVYDATVGRMMKAHKTVKNQALIREAISEIS